MWRDVVYEPGELRATAYKAGKKLGERAVRTAGKPARLKLAADRAQIEAGSLDLSYFLVEALDEKGNPAPLADNKVEITLEGTGSIAGAGNGNPQSFEPFQAEHAYLFNGKAVVIVRAGREAGRVAIRVRAEGLEGDTAEVMVK